MEISTMAIKNMTVSEYTAEAPSLPGVVLSGDFVRVDCDEAGAFMMIEEPEYQIMRDALAAIIQLGAKGKLPDALQRFLK
jgi:hypothetical protein